MEMTGIPLDENDLKAKHAEEFANAIILTINALNITSSINSTIGNTSATTKTNPKGRAAYIINRKPSVGTVISNFKEKPMTKLSSIASVAGTNKIIHNAFNRKNQKYQKIQTE